MNARATITDQHSIEHQFEEIEIEIDGILIGSFSGTAELALNDDRYDDFYVKRISLNGRRRVRANYPFGLRIRKFEDAMTHLTRPGYECRTFNANLFRKLEARLYEDEAAKAAWASEMEDA